MPAGPMAARSTFVVTAYDLATSRRRVPGTSAPALDGVSLGVQAGKLTAIAGDGPDTLVRVLAGVARPARGRIFLARQDLAELAPRTRDALVASALGYADGGRRAPATPAGVHLLAPLDHAPTQPEPQWLAALTGLLGMDDELSVPVNRLAPGRARMLGLARAMVHRPAAVLVVAPTRGLDPDDAEMVLRFLRAVVDVPGLAVVAATDDQRLIDVADRVLVLSGGRIAEDLLRPNPLELAVALSAGPS